MLVLARKKGEKIRINHDIVVVLIENRGKLGVRIGIEAPSNVPVHREEVYQAILRDNGDMLGSVHKNERK